jgi:hypothetical protein
MRVTRHDGTPYHLLGVVPDVSVSPTVAGLRAGRDEELDRALALVSVRNEAVRPELLLTECRKAGSRSNVENAVYWRR